MEESNGSAIFISFFILVWVFGSGANGQVNRWLPGHATFYGASQNPTTLGKATALGGYCGFPGKVSYFHELSQKNVRALVLLPFPSISFHLKQKSGGEKSLG